VIFLMPFLLEFSASMVKVILFQYMNLPNN
jgi:hypothetical protein